MVRTGCAVPGEIVRGKLRWERNGKTIGSIGYRADMVDAGDARLDLAYKCNSGGNIFDVEQSVQLIFTLPPYGGRRWWMLCPLKGIRVRKIYMPADGDRFASRQALRLGYQCQRLKPCDKPLTKLFALQMKLGGQPGLDKLLHRPKGMWRRTFARHQIKYYCLSERVVAEMIAKTPQLAMPMPT